MEETEAITALAKTLRDDNALTTWSEDKTKNFIATYNQRVNCARYILTKTADLVWDAAKAKHFVGYTMEVDKRLSAGGVLQALGLDAYYHGQGPNTVKALGRSMQELDQIAEERAQTILKGLPALKNVVEILSPDMTAKMIRIDTLRAKVKKSKEALEEMGGEIRMSELPDTMTILEFRTMVKDRTKSRKKHVDLVEEASKEAMELQSALDRFLYKGVPGLDKAVADTCTELIDQAIALGTSSRRVEESLLFGDSDLAASLLTKFETDEQTVSSDVAKRFTSALEALKLSKGAVRKKLAASRGNKKKTKKGS